MIETQGFCKKGHPFDKINSLGNRYCGTCHKQIVSLYEKTDLCKERHSKWAKGEKRKAYAKEYYLKNAEQSYFNYAKRKYGLLKSDIKQLLEKQGGRCAICEVSEIEMGNKLHIDHNHRTGKVRGLLCRPCNNFVVVVAEHYIHLFEKAKTYLGD